MYIMPKTEKSALQQQRFAATLLDLSQTRSFEDIAVTELCQKSGMTRRTFYRLYTCKEDILIWLVDQAVWGHTRSPMWKWTNDPSNLVAFFCFWLEEKTLLDVLCQCHQTSLLVDRSALFIAKERPELVQMLGGSDPCCRDENLVFFLSGLIGLLINWHRSGYSKSPGEMAQIFYSMLTTPPLHS